METFEYGSQGAAFAPIHRALKKLNLPALSVRSDNQAACHLIGNDSAEITSDKVKAKIQSCRTASRGEYLTLVNIEDSGVYLNSRITAAERVCIAPVRGCPLPIEQSRCCQHKGARADG